MKKAAAGDESATALIPHPRPTRSRQGCRVKVKVALRAPSAPANGRVQREAAPVYDRGRHRFEGDTTLSPTQLAVRCAQLIKDLEIARTARDLPRMQELVAQHQRLLEAVYGLPLAK